MRKTNPLSAEDRLIEQYFRPIATHSGALALTDDAAFLTPPSGYDVVLKTDAIVGGVHFFEDDPPGAIARKALRVNLSDLAAKGAKPAGFLLSLALPKDAGAAWLKPFAVGLKADAKKYECPLFGGDSVRTPGPVTISVAAIGIVPKGKMVRRAGAKPGHIIFATGTIGDAALGLRLRREPRNTARWELDARKRDHLLARYLTPQPRSALAAAVRRFASAAMDVSDGLAGDLAKLCRVSGVGAKVEIARVPLSAAGRAALAADPDLIETILTGGDDYEIIGAVPAARFYVFCAAAKSAGVAVTEIGRFEQGQGASFLGQSGARMVFSQPSFSHF